METKSMTIKDILVDIIDVLGKIKVPMTQLEEIGIPIGRAINGLQVCVDSINQAEAVQKQEDAPEEGNIIDLGEIQGDEAK